MTLPPKPAPVTERDSVPFWEALARHELALQRCDGCQTWRWPPRAICKQCGSFESTWVPAVGTGTVASWIVNHHSFNPAFESPYVVLAVRLDDQSDIVMYGEWAGSPDGNDLVLDLPVTVDYDDIAPAGDGADDDEGFTLLRWRATAS